MVEDLRIGNLVLREDLVDTHLRVETIIALYQRKALVSGPINVMCFYKHLTPIPISERWLFRFGFKNRRLCFIIKINDITSLMLDFNESNKECFVILIQVQDKIHLPKIKYVHQLQNLYFALSQKELILKPL